MNRVFASLAAAFALTALTATRAAHAELLAAGPNGAVDESRPAKPTGVVDVHLFAGQVKVTGWAQNFVHVKGTIDSDCKVEITPSGDRTQVSVHCDDSPADGELEVQVPQGSSLEIRTMSAPVSVRDVNGALHLHTVAADITVVGGTSAEIEARTTSGSIDVKANAAWTRAHTVSGEVSVNGGHGKASLHSVSGACSLVGGVFTEVSMQSVSGEISFDGTLAPQGNVEVQSHSGDVSVKVPAATNADVELRSFNGELVVDHPSGRREGGRTLDTRLGTGGAKVRAHSFSGDVTVTAKK